MKLRISLTICIRTLRTSGLCSLSSRYNQTVDQKAFVQKTATSLPMSSCGRLIFISPLCINQYRSDLLFCAGFSSGKKRSLGYCQIYWSRVTSREMGSNRALFLFLLRVRISPVRHVWTACVIWSSRLSFLRLSYFIARTVKVEIPTFALFCNHTCVGAP